MLAYVYYEILRSLRQSALCDNVINIVAKMIIKISSNPNRPVSVPALQGEPEEMCPRTHRTRVHRYLDIECSSIRNGILQTFLYLVKRTLRPIRQLGRHAQRRKCFFT
ncbi:hypothetical protein ABW19_dt0208538 [Dactylella cylindrospora]|nr:hypothetical protein ABW19_dt0208538 [Dactylella cylindrospora]